MIRGLIVDDERAFARLARRTLSTPRKAGGMAFDDCRTGLAALARVRRHRYDVVLVDWVLPDMNGVELGERIRMLPHGAACALIMVTGRQIDTQCEQTAFAAGFDDFVRKPYEPATLSLRIAAVVRRCRQPLGGAVARVQYSDRRDSWHALRDPALEVFQDEPAVVVFARRVELTALPWRLLLALYRHRGHAVLRSALVEAVWRTEPPADPNRALDRLVGVLRASLGAAGSLIKTVHGHGYRLEFWVNPNDAK